MSKAVEAFRNIGEVSSELGVKKHVLRFWEQKFPQLKPMKRGGGRRLYRPVDVQLLKGIRDLLQDAGYTIKGVQKLLREQGVEHVKKAADGWATGSANGARGKPAASSRQIGGGHALFSSAQVQVLRSIMTELDACQALLASPEHAKAGGQRDRRATSRA